MTVFIRSFSSWGNCAHLNSWLTLQTLSLSFQLIFLMSGSDRLFWFSCWNMRHKEYRGIRKIIFPVEFYFSMLLLFLRDARVLLCPFVSFYLPQCVQGSACSCAEAERRGSSYAILYQPAPKSIYLEGWLFHPVYGSTQVPAPLPYSSLLPARNTPGREQVFLQPSSAAVSAAVIPTGVQHSHAASVLTMTIS